MNSIRSAKNHVVGGPRVAEVAYTIVAVMAYMVAVCALFPIVGIGARALTILLLLAAAWRWGMWGAVVSFVLSIPLVLTVTHLAAQPERMPPSALPFLLVALFTAMLLGKTRALGLKLRRELAERKIEQKLLATSEQGYRLLFETNPQPMWVVDAESLRFLAVNEAATRHYGYSQEAFRGMTIFDLIDAGDVPALRFHLTRSAQAGPFFEVRQRMQDGTWIDVEITAQAIGFQGREARLLLLNDVTERKRDRQRLEYQAHHDALTGLPNRFFFTNQLEHWVTLARRQPNVFSLLLLDLDGFKEINDTLGHPCGDLVLQEVGARLRGALRESDLLVRLGGDEFGMLLPQTDLPGAVLAAERVIDSLQQPLEIEGKSLEVGGSVGIAVAPDHATEAEALLRLADVAMYSAKRSGGGYAVYSPDRNRYTMRRLALLGELRQGIRNNELLLHYQAKVDLVSLRPQSAEALVRWQHPCDGLIGPTQFLPLAEHTGLIKPLSYWVLNTALLQCRLWRLSGINLHVAVNLPASSLPDPLVVPTITSLLESTDTLPDWLTVEVSESALIADPRSAVPCSTSFTRSVSRSRLTTSARASRHWPT
jgi:diguanylate cyclase (GGDEF)-like protein/PAS domain S-box-containing protein